jgi:ribosome maturation factor RimP
MTEGNEIRSLLLFPKLMNVEAPIKAIEQKVNQLLENEPGFFLVEVTLKPTNNIKVFVDADHGASIDRLVYLNRALYKQVEETMFPNGDFSLEVSSPGLDEPLKLHRQYVKNIGRNVEVLLNSGIKREGKLISAGENEIVIEEEKGKGKNKEFARHSIVKADIKTTKIQIKF